VKKRQLLLSAVSSLMIAVLALTAGTFAWFEFSLTPEVEAFDLDIVSGDALQIAVVNSPGAFGNIILKADFFNRQIDGAEASFPGVAAYNFDGADRDYKLNAATPKYSNETGTALDVSNNKLTFYSHLIDGKGKLSSSGRTLGRTYVDYTTLAEAVATFNSATNSFDDGGILRPAQAGNDFIHAKVYLRSNTSLKVNVDFNDMFKSVSDSTADVNAFNAILKSLRIAFVYKNMSTSVGDIKVFSDVNSLLKDTNETLSDSQRQEVARHDQYGFPLLYNRTGTTPEVTTDLYGNVLDPATDKHGVRTDTVSLNGFYGIKENLDTDDLSGKWGLFDGTNFSKQINGNYEVWETEAAVPSRWGYVKKEFTTEINLDFTSGEWLVDDDGNKLVYNAATTLIAGQYVVAFDNTMVNTYTYLTPNYADTKFNSYTRIEATGIQELFEITMGTDVISSSYEVNVYIWLEGYDKDTNLQVAGSSFNTLLKFTGVPV